MHHNRRIGRHGATRVSSVLRVGTAAAVLLGTMVAGAVAAPASYAATSVSGVLTPVTPQRILNTRSFNGADTPIGAMQTMRVPVLGVGGIPPAGVSAVLLNVTTVNAVGSGYLTVYQTGAARPSISTLNYPVSQPTANEALVPVGADGTVSIYNYSGGSTDVLVDAEGWVSDRGAGNGTVSTSQPTRVLDTRTTVGGHNAALTLGQTITVPVEGVGNVPTTGVTAVFADIIAVPAAGSGGYLTAYSSDTVTTPTVSNVNFAAGQVTSSMSLIQVGANGSIKVYSGSPSTDVVVDVMGWVSGGDVTTDAGLQGLSPQRILDTRTTLGGHNAPLSAGETFNLPVLGVGGVPSSGVAGVAVHIAGVDPTVGTYLQTYGSGYTENTITTNGSLLNQAASTTVSNSIVVPVGPNGKISIYNFAGNENLVVDVEGYVAAPVFTVTPPVTSALSGATITSDAGKQAAAILTNANKYAMTTWWNSVAPGLLTEPLTNAQDGSDAVIRRLASEAYSLATSLTSGAYDPTATGVPASTATADAVQLITAVANAHMANSPGGWGAKWTSSFDAAYAGTAAWLLWSQLPAQTQTAVERFVYFEANWGAGVPLQYYANASGTVIHPGDTGSDPDSWLAMPAQLAAVMMPSNPNVPMWNFLVVRNALASWARPSDVSSTTQVNGASVATWLGTSTNVLGDGNTAVIGGGSNALADGSVLNHGRIAYDYSTLIYQTMQAVLLDTMAGTSAPQATKQLLGPVYAAFTTNTYSPPTYDAPGGTAYKPNGASAGDPTIYYPQGIDWGTGQEIPFALIDAETGAFGADTTGTAASYESLHGGAELAMQNAHSDGHTYDSGQGLYSFVGREEQVSQLAAQLYFTEAITSRPSPISWDTTSHWMPLN